MRSIRQVALDLFDERGFAAVKIDDVARAAGVSASSIYRYFGTKEGLLATDEFETMSQADVEELFDLADPVGSVVRIAQGFETSQDTTTGGDPAAARRIRYFFDEPSVRQAVCASLDRAAQRVAMLLVGDQLNQTQARVAANALAFGYFGALEQWHINGADRPIAEYVEEGLRPLRSIWSTSAGGNG